jgi:hypothetical protein
MSDKTNDQIILEQILRERAAEASCELSLQDFFEIYTASEILKDHDLTYDDISYGIVGNSGDGGVDSIFTFLNGEQIKEDTQINSNQKKNHIELNIIQSKTSPSFSEAAITKLGETAEDLFNLANEPSNFQSRYNAELIDRVALFRNVYSKLAKSFPSVSIKFWYATLGTDVHPNVDGKVTKLREKILRMFGGANFNFEFAGASRLLEMTRAIPSTSRTLEVAESPIGTDSGSYVCLVTLSKYFGFISDSGALARSIFEANVRDYQGSVIVNTGIRKTLENADSENFWYLNNGVTVITPKAVLAGKQLTIEDPQIVNGLQTSHEIYEHFAAMENPVSDDRCILVRIICEENEEARDRIIRATNSQTSIPPASLRSSDHIHRNIEDFLKANGYFYDRKKNFYKNQGKPIAKIISISYMAQAMMAITLFKPDSARARPSTLINSDPEYERIFSLDTPIDVYLKVIQIMKSVEDFLRRDIDGTTLDRKTVTNIKFYVAALAARKLSLGEANIIKGLHKLGSIRLQDSELKECYVRVIGQFHTLGGSDQVAKGTSLVAALNG